MEKLKQFCIGGDEGYYSDTYHLLDKTEYSCGVAPWLSNGSLSARRAWWTLKRLEKKGFTNSAQKFINELYWREFCQFWCIKYGNKIFNEYGIDNRKDFKWH